MSATIEALAWMAGNWEGDVDPWGGTWYESWTGPSGGVLLGVAKHVESEANELRFTEFLSIETIDETVVMRVWTNALKDIKEPHVFPLASTDGTAAVFENPAYAFPRRIIYERNENNLFASVEGERNGESVTISFRLKSMG